MWGGFWFECYEVQKAMIAEKLLLLAPSIRDFKVNFLKLTLLAKLCCMPEFWDNMYFCDHLHTAAVNFIFL